jgi:hypothetical protein
MDEEELANLLNSLEEGLNQVGLSSLVDQERISAVEGRIEELTAGEVAQLRREWARQRRGQAAHLKVGDVRTRPLTAGERLAELLDLVEAAVGGSYAIEMHLRDDVKTALNDDEHAWNGEIVFADPPESAPTGLSRVEWALPDQSALQQRAVAVREVILLINQLRNQADLPRSERLHSTAVPDDGDTNLPIPGDWS